MSSGPLGPMFWNVFRMSFSIAEINADVKPNQISVKTQMLSIVLDQHEICNLQVSNEPVVNLKFQK